MVCAFKKNKEGLALQKERDYFVLDTMPALNGVPAERGRQRQPKHPLKEKSREGGE